MRAAVFNRRAFVAVTACTAVSLSVSALWAQSRLEKPKISIAVSGRSDFSLLPLTIAERRGFFRAEGLDVEVIEFANATNAFQAVLHGAAHVGSAGYERTLSPLAREHGLQSFVLQGRSPAVAVGVSTRVFPSFRSVAELKGRRIGIMGPGLPAHAAVHRVLARAGLDSQDVSYVTVDSADVALSAFRAGHIDALSHVDPVLTMLLQKGELQLVADTRTLKESKSLFGGPLPGSCLIASAVFLQQNPNTAQALTHAMVRAQKWLQTAGPSDLIKVVPESQMLGDRALYLAAFNQLREVISVDAVMPEEGPPTALRMFAQLDSALQPQRIDLSKTYTNQFASVAKARFKA